MKLLEGSFDEILARHDEARGVTAGGEALS